MYITGLIEIYEFRAIQGAQRALDILAGFAKRTGSVLTNGLSIRASVYRTTVDDHLLRDMGVTRLGVQEAALARRHELPSPTRRQ